MHTATKTMTSRDVRRAFVRYWTDRCKFVPAYRDDLPAKRMAFSCFIDDLERDGRITEKVAQNVTMG